MTSLITCLAHRSSDHLPCTSIVRLCGEAELESLCLLGLRFVFNRSSSAAEESALASHSPMGGILSSLCRCFIHLDQPSNDVLASCREERGGVSVREADWSVVGMSEMEISNAIDKSKEQGWTETRVGASSSGGLDDSAIWKELKAMYPRFFIDDLDVNLGRLIVEGGQAQIYEATVFGLERVVKVFKMEGFCLEDLKRQWPLATKTPKKSLYEQFVLGKVVFGESMLHCSHSYQGTFLEDGRFAFVMRRYWGDLQTLIDVKRSENNFQVPPFLDYEAKRFMEEIARGMKNLHERGVLHRDLKAANVLLFKSGSDFYHCEVGDFESSMMVQGTGFWRAPEVLEDLMKVPCDGNPNIWTEKVDVYSFAMTCYEILTGLMPFEGYGYKKSDWHKVIEGERLRWPNYVDSTLRNVVERCWHKEPSKRPTFEVILSQLRAYFEVGDLTIKEGEEKE